MELTVLGGSAAAPNPGDASSGYLVTSGDTTILLDCGSGVVSKLRAQTDERVLSGVVISHLHADHTIDLVTLRYALKYAPPRTPSRGDEQPSPSPIPLHLPPGGLPFLARLSAAFQTGNEEGQDFWGEVFVPREYRSQVEGDQPLTIGALTLRFAPMCHYIPTWAIRITDERTGRALTYSADTGPQAPLAEFAAGGDLLLCEATLLQQPAAQDPAGYGHLTATEAGQIATAAGVERLLLTHLWAELDPDQSLADARAAFAGPVERARAGLILTV